MRRQSSLLVSDVERFVIYQMLMVSVPTILLTYENIVLGYDAWGDWISYNGLIDTLLKDLVRSILS